MYTFIFSEVHGAQSAGYETVLESFRRNGVGVKGIISSPHTFKGTELQTLNMKIRYTPNVGHTFVTENLCKKLSQNLLDISGWYREIN